MATNLYNLQTLGLADKAFGAVHSSHAGIRGVAPVTRDAAKASARMDIGRKFLHRFPQPVITKILMASNAAIALLFNFSAPHPSREHGQNQASD
jgi:hypothetical protein